MERVAWLSVHGISLQLLESEVLLQIGELFGKVLHVPKSLFRDSDLSVFKIGVLAGEAQRIREVVSLKWKDRNFRVWVEEDQDVWVPDCLDGEACDSPTADSPLVSSPVVGMVRSKAREGGEVQKSKGLEVVFESPVNVIGVFPMQEEEYGHGDTHFNDVNTVKVVGPSAECANLGTSMQSNDEGGAILGNGVSPSLASNRSRGCGVKVFGINDNIAFTDGVRPSLSKSGGPPKRARGYKKKNGGNAQAHDNSGINSGEPKTKKMRRAEEVWPFPLGNTDQVESSAQPVLNPSPSDMGNPLDLNVEAQEEAVDLPDGGSSSVQVEIYAGVD
ncbi:hypothetical protein Hdeb2414_s0001g00032151 [Helianthus debilis subsp. tardiflorus]